MFKKTILLMALAMLIVHAQTQQQQPAAPNPISLPGAESRVYKTVGEVKLYLHVFRSADRPKTEKLPAIVFFFGGGWNSGTVNQFVKHSEYLASRGMVAVIADYRVKSRHGVTPIECVADAKSAIRWVRAHAVDFGIDANRIVAAGGSAGGHLAAVTALVKGLDEKGEDLKISSAPNALALFNPALDLSAPRLREMIGERALEISPLHHVRQGAPPAIIFHGTADTTVPFKQAEDFCAAMKRQGNRCELAPYEGRTHGFFNYGRGDGQDYRTTLRATDEFLVSLGYLKGAPAQPNILILYADDWRHDTLGVAGNPIVKTPHLDQLAKQGVRFRRSYVTTSICGVSRATLFTGQWMSRHGNTAFDAFKTPWAETYPGLLRAAGYWVGHIGKWHNGKFPAEHFDFGRSYSGRHYLKQPDGTTVHVTQKNESDALEFLRSRPADKPFCLTLAFFATHAEDQHPKQYLYQPQSESLYQNVTIPVPKTMSDEHFKRLPPFVANEKNEGRNRWHWRFDTSEKYQQYMKAYYRLATEVDATVGRVLAELKAQGLDETTLVIFTTDNGYFHGEHGLADKWYPYEESIRVPLIVRDPRLPASKRGSTNDDIVLNADLAPTILAFAGIAAPARMQGRDCAPLYLAARKPAWRDEFFYEHATIRNTDFIPSSEALVRKEIKYIRWPDFNDEDLFDLRRDPLEERNLAADPAYRATLAKLRRRFAQLRAQAR